jgi:branched-chain amino acid transport system ATP-binding protein
MKTSLPVLELNSISKRFGGVIATDDLSLLIKNNTIHALIGPNGAGKTTLLSQISGSLMPDQGCITFQGRDITRYSLHERVMVGIARSYQITNIFKGGFTVLDNISLAVQHQLGVSGRFWTSSDVDAQITDRSMKILYSVGLTEFAEQEAQQLSYGQQRHLEIGLALAAAPSLLLLDEPMAGVSGEESVKLTKLIHSLKKEMAIVLVEHDMDAVFSLADEVSVLVYGRIIATGSPDQIKSDSEVQMAYLGDEVSFK